MEASVAEVIGAPESWEVSDVDATMSRLLVDDPKADSKHSHTQTLCDSVSAAGSSDSSRRVLEDDAINHVDLFLREALQNPRERLSVLRMEQDVEKFISDPAQQQLEFHQLPTSYLQLAAHRVAQHYLLQSMVLVDNSLPDGSGSKIIVHKTPECRCPVIRLADVPVNLPSEDGGVVKVAIKQRPQKRSQNTNNSNSNIKTNISKSVEERKEEYNKARARIFSGSSNGVVGKAEGEVRPKDGIRHGPVGTAIKVEDKPAYTAPATWDVNSGRDLNELSTSGHRPTRTRTEKEPVGRSNPNNRVAIFRDREVDRRDPDYDRSYGRYMQRFDPGSGFNGGPYTMQPIYIPAVNYNTEFPQLGSSHRPQIATEHQPQPIPQHLPGPWSAPSTPAGIRYCHPETVMLPFNPSHLGARMTSSMHMNSMQYHCQRLGMPLIFPHEHVQPFSQAHQQPPDGSFGLARPW